MRNNSKRSNGLWRRKSKVAQSPPISPPLEDRPSAPVHVGSETTSAPMGQVFDALSGISQPYTNADEMRSTILRHVYPHYTKFQDYHYTRLPGPQPHGASKRSLRKILKKEYLVSEKSDGVRVMLYIQNRQAYFIDRRFNVYAVNSRPLRLFSTNNDTLIDGELVLCQMRDEEGEADQESSLMFLMFDCVVYDGENVSGEMTNDRIEYCREFDHAFARFLRKHRNSVPFCVEAKQMVSTRDIHLVMSRISRDDFGDYNFVSIRRVSKNDGLIFTPVRNNYTMKEVEDLSIYKWKPSEKMTIDFMVIAPFWEGNDLVLYELFEDGKKCVRHRPCYCERRELVERDFEKYLRKVREVTGRRRVDSFVVECLRDRSGEWRLVGLRLDKTHANKSDVVNDTLKNARENFTFDELTRFFGQH